jgi:hypothetical protein
MRRAIVFSIALAAAASLLGEKRTPEVRAAIATVEKSIDQRFAALMPENPYVVLGMTRGIYLKDYGAVFSLELNLVTTVPISPFYRNVPPARVEKIHQEKLERLKTLRSVMRDALVDAAGSLDMVKPDEQIALGVTLFNHAWENTEGIPGQIVMQARKQALLKLKAEASDKSKWEAAIEEREF